MSQIDDVLSTARSQLGYTESPRGSNLQKYGAEFGWNGVAWCSIFQWWIFKHAGLEGLYPKTASTRVSLPWFKQRGLIRSSKNDGQPGDLIWYDFGTPDPVNHIGIIEQRLGPGHYQTIEGNTSPTSQANGGAVMRRDRSGSSIVAVGRPQYNLEENALRTMYDAAFPPGSPPNVDAVAGYIGGGTPHVWTDAEWASQMEKASAQLRLPVFVRGSLSAAQSHDPVADADFCADWAEAHGQPHGTLIALDYETTVYAPYLIAFNNRLNQRGYKCIVYGSRSFVMQNPEPSGGYWTATWNNVPHLDAGATITQYGGDTTLGQPWDLNVIADGAPLWGAEQETFLMALTDGEQSEVLRAARQINSAVGAGQISFEKTIEAILATVQTLINEGRSQSSNIITQGQASADAVQAAIVGYLTAHPATAVMSDADKQAIVDGVVAQFTSRGLPVDTNAILDALNARLAA